MVPGCVPFKIVSDSPTLHSRWLLFLKVMIISLWNLLQYHSIVRWAIQAQWAEPLVSETTKQVWIKLGRNVHWMVIYKIFVFGADRKSNMAARTHNVFWLVEILKIFLLETTKPIELWLCRNDHWVVLY